MIENNTTKTPTYNRLYCLYIGNKCDVPALPMKSCPLPVSLKQLQDVPTRANAPICITCDVPENNIS